MDYVVYHNISDDRIRDGMISTIKKVSESAYCKGYVVMVKNSDIFERQPQDLIQCIEEYLLEKRLNKNDEIYVCFPDGKQMGLWRVKKAGRSKIRRWPVQ